MSDFGLFDAVLAAGPVRDIVSDAGWLRAMLETEAALAQAGAEVGLFDAASAQAIVDAAVVENFDLAAIGAGAAGIGNPTGPLVRALTRQAEDAGKFVHYGATSQDIVDTAAMLLSREAFAALDDELTEVAESLANLAQEHRDTVVAGRSLGQHALPTSFGYVVAGWLEAIVEVQKALRETEFPAELGGAVGTLASVGSSGPALRSAFARILGLADPRIPWHTNRLPIAAVATAAGSVSGVASSIAGTLISLSQTEIGEVYEEGPAGSGGSSTMPHKRNPIAAVSSFAATTTVPALVGTLLTSMAHQHQRAVGQWHAEWRTLSELLRSTGSAVHWLAESLRRLHVDTGKMAENLAIVGGVLQAEQVTSALVPVLGRLGAHDAVTACCRKSIATGESLAEILAADPLLSQHLTTGQINQLLDPVGYLGSAQFFTDEVLANYRKARQ
jgi:3-carboxy-cis,cis-muconate cycloisomerase